MTDLELIESEIVGTLTEEWKGTLPDFHVLEDEKEFSVISGPVKITILKTEWLPVSGTAKKNLIRRAGFRLAMGLRAVVLEIVGKLDTDRLKEIIAKRVN